MAHALANPSSQLYEHWDNPSSQNIRLKSNNGLHHEQLPEYEEERWERVSQTEFDDQDLESDNNSEDSCVETAPVHEVDVPTPPIDVPAQLKDARDTRPIIAGLHEPSYFENASVEEYLAKRRTSIAFDPEVKLDGGARSALEAPLPKLAVKTRSRGRSLLEEFAKKDKKSGRAHSETDQEEYDSETGERLDEFPQKPRDGKYTTHQPRWPLLQTTVDELAAKDLDADLEQSVSLTSNTTASPKEEIDTPSSDNIDTFISPLSISSPSKTEWYFPNSFQPPRRLSSRSKSYALDQPRSFRRSSRRSTANSISPAASFLSKYLPSSPVSSPDDEGQEVGDYVLGREIGFGGFSVIREAYTIASGQRFQCAVKIVRRQVTGKEELENDTLQAEFEHEVSLWRCLSHTHIIPLIAVYVTSFATFAFIPLNVGGTLFDAVRNNRSGLPSRFVRRYAYQVASALRYLHEDMRIVHRDLKLENCLLDMSDPCAGETGGKVLLCDFGLADYLTPSPTQSSNTNHTSAPTTSGIPVHDPRAPHSPRIGPSGTSTNMAGSLPYAAPEMLEVGSKSGVTKILSPRVDMWAYGVVCFALAMGKLPFTHAFAPRVRAMIMGGEWDVEGLRGKEAADWNGDEPYLEGVVDLVQGCLDRDLETRWNISRCLQNNWLVTEAAIEEDGDGEQSGGWGNTGR